MILPRPDRSFKNLRRYNQIARVLVKHGFGDIVYRMNLSSPLKLGKKSPKVSFKSTPERLRLALDELGPTFVKLGQIMSTRPFLLPIEYIEELSKLQDQVEPMPSAKAKEILTAELKCPLSEYFSEFEEDAFASASLAQAHNAVLKDGTQVVVKIQREGIKGIIDPDMKILYDIAELLVKNVPESNQFDPKGIVGELSRSTQKEINFLNESRNLEIFAENFKDEPGIKIPKVFSEYSTSKIIVLEKIDGIKISKIDELKKAGYDPEIIVKNGARLVLKMIFEDGFFHADPHPGNLFVCENNIIAPVDFGMMGVLSGSQMNYLADLIIAFMSKDAGTVIRVMQNAEIIEDDVNFRMMEQDLSEMMLKYYHMSLARIDMKLAMNDFFIIVQRYNIRFQAEFMLLGKALMIYEELARVLYQEFNFFAEMIPYVKKLTARKYNPGNFIKDLIRSADELKWLLIELPRKIRHITNKLSEGELQVRMQHKGLENLIREIDKSSNRLSVSMLIAALIVGSSLIMTVDKGIMIFDFPVMGLIGFLFAGILGIFLVISILRAGKL
ncbi:MAG: AarF/ABC1/UbiB kinase family protein [candidate division Zixibacteria bacterium]|nr:AarF/ABC1/UbiB kinase family protein [candidate division Zixibacteria bacterium]